MSCGNDPYDLDQKSRILLLRRISLRGQWLLFKSPLGQRMSSSATYNLIFPPGCDGKNISPGCFPCPSNLNDAPTTSAQQYVVGGAGLQVNTVKLGSQQAQYNYTVVSTSVPIQGVQNGLVLYMSACQSPVQASVVILPTGADVATSLTSLYNL